MPTTKPYIEQDEHGVFRVAGTHVMLDSVVAAYRQGHSPETIVQQYPSLSLEQVYGTIADYLADQLALDGYLQSQSALWEMGRSGNAASPVAERLRKSAAARSSTTE